MIGKGDNLDEHDYVSEKGDDMAELSETTEERISRVHGQPIPRPFTEMLDKLRHERDAHVEVFNTFMQWYADRQMVNRDANNENWYQIYDYFGIPKEERHIWYCAEVNNVWIMLERDVDNPHRKRVDDILHGNDDETGPGYVGGPAGPQE